MNNTTIKIKLKTLKTFLLTKFVFGCFRLMGADFKFPSAHLKLVIQLKGQNQSKLLKTKKRLLKNDEKSK